MDDTEDSPATIGHNMPPIDLATVLDGDLLRAQLEQQQATLLKRKAELLAGYFRFIGLLGEKGTIEDEDTLNRAASFEKQIRDQVKVVEAAREEVKKPINEAAAVVQGFFKAHMADPLLQAADAIRGKRTTYLQEVERRRREMLADEARLRQIEANRLAEEAQRTNDAAKMEQAIQADQQAADLQHTADTAKPADLTRTRSDLGVTSSLRTTLKFRVTDKAKVPLHLMAVVDAAVLAMAKTVKDPVVEQPVPGIEYYRESSAR